MSDYHGKAPLPVQGSEGIFGTEATTEAFSDPALKVLADFLKEVIRAEMGDGWAATFPTNPEVCGKAYPHDPREELLESNWLPALFCWRASVTPTRFEDGNHGSTSTIICFWVFPPADEELMAAMAPTLNGMAATLVKALDVDHGNGRHPAYVIESDTDPEAIGYDPHAETYGSSILEHGGFWELEFDGEIHYSDVSFATDSRGTVSYQALMWQLRTREHFVPGEPEDLGTTIQATIDEPGDDPVFVQTTTISAG